jgi:hypothetical protein
MGQIWRASWLLLGDAAGMAQQLGCFIPSMPVWARVACWTAVVARPAGGCRRQGGILQPPRVGGRLGGAMLMHGGAWGSLYLDGRDGGARALRQPKRWLPAREGHRVRSRTWGQRQTGRRSGGRLARPCHHGAEGQQRQWCSRGGQFGPNMGSGSYSRGRSGWGSREPVAWWRAALPVAPWCDAHVVGWRSQAVDGWASPLPQCFFIYSNFSKWIQIWNGQKMIFWCSNVFE